MLKANSNGKKDIIYIILSSLTILILIITSGVLYNAYKNSKDETHLIEKKYESIANSTDKKYEAVVYSLEKKLEEVVNSSKKNNEATVHLFDEKYNSIVDLFQKKLETFVNSTENKYELIMNLSTKNNEQLAKAFEDYSIDDESDFDTKNLAKNSYIGENIILKCINTKNSISIINHWYHNDVEIDLSNSTKYKLQNGNLKFKILNETDEGRYKCHSTNNNINKTIFYDIYVQYVYKWVKPYAVDAEYPLYMEVKTHDFSVGRANWYSNLVPGTVHYKYPSMVYAAVDGKSQLIFDMEFLMINKNINYLWIQASHGNVPPNALKGGFTANGETLYIGRHYVRNNFFSGMIQPSAGCLRIATEDEVSIFHDYQVLVIPNFNGVMD